MRKALGIVIAASLLAAIGCGGGSGPQGDLLAQGRTALYGMASGDSIASKATLDLALRFLDRALKERPDSAEAKFWTAVCLVGLAGMDVSGVTASDPEPPANSGMPDWSSDGGGEGWVAPDPGDGTIPGAPPDHDGPVPPVEPPHRIGLFWHLRFAVANPFTLLAALAPAADIRLGVPGVLGGWGENPQAQMETLARLNRADQLLSEVEAVPDFAVELPDPDRDGRRLRIELPEVHLFHAYVHTLRAEVALALAYVRDIGPDLPIALAEKDPADPERWNPFDDLDKNGDGLLTPDEYLPGDPFLTLRDGAYLGLARDAMIASADHGDKGCMGVLARTETEGYLINNVSPYREALQKMQESAIPLLRKAALGPVELLVPRYEYTDDAVSGSAVRSEPCGVAERNTFNLDPDPGDCIGWGPPTIVMRTVRINLAAWFDAPPPDLKKFAPAIALTAEGWPDFDRISLPDPTFAGLFPDGVQPEDFLYGSVMPLPMMAGAIGR